MIEITFINKDNLIDLQEENKFMEIIGTKEMQSVPCVGDTVLLKKDGINNRFKVSEIRHVVSFDNRELCYSDKLEILEPEDSRVFVVLTSKE